MALLRKSVSLSPDSTVLIYLSLSTPHPATMPIHETQHSYQGWLLLATKVFASHREREWTYSETDHSNATDKELVLLRETYPTRCSEDTVFNLWLHLLNLKCIKKRKRSQHNHLFTRDVSCVASKNGL